METEFDNNGDSFYKELQEIKKTVFELRELLIESDGMSFGDEILNSKQVMRLLQISEPTLIKLEAQKKIKYKRVGREKRYLRSDIFEYMRKAS